MDTSSNANKWHLIAGAFFIVFVTAIVLMLLAAIWIDMRWAATALVAVAVGAVVIGLFPEMVEGKGTRDHNPWL